MPTTRLRLLPFDPADALLASAAALIRGGLTGSPAWAGSPQPQPDWDAGAACPADHFCCSQGTKLWIGTQGGNVKEAPLHLILSCPEEGREKSTEVKGAWALFFQAQVRTLKDTDPALAEALIARLLVLFTHPLKMEDNSIQQPQTRLSTATLHLFGSTHHNNFEETAHGKISDESSDDHPLWAFSTRITCAVVGAPT